MPSEQTKAKSKGEAFTKLPWRKCVSILLAVVLLAGIGRMLYVNREQLSSIHDISLGLSLLIALVYLVDYGIIGTMLNTSTRVLGCPLKAKEYLGLSYIGALYNLALPMKGGIFVKSYYLKAHRSFPIKLFTLVTFVQTLIFMLVASLTGVSLILFSSHPLKDQVLAILLLFVGIAAASASMLSGHLLIRPLAKKYKLILQFSSSWKRIVYTRTFWSLAGQGLIRAWLGALRVYLTFHALGLSVSFYDAMIAGITLMVVTNFSITPGNLGVRELALGFIMALLGYSSAQVLLVGVVERAIQILVLIPSGLGSTLLLFGSLWANPSAKLAQADES